MRSGERGPDTLRSARFGGHEVTRDHVVVADDDGAGFVLADRLDEVAATARAVHETECEQARRIRARETPREQTTFGGYLDRRAADPAYSFRRHLRRVGGAVEE